MFKYLILQHPGHNRVYYNLSGELALAELKISSGRLDANCVSIEIVEIEKVRYLALSSQEEITDYDLQTLSRLSFVFAIFRVDQIKGKPCFIPISKYNYEYVDSKISSLQKYAGKTNELFTKMMINVALLSSNFDYTDKIKLLDPVAGKGTTLYEGVVYGFDVTGIEVEAKSVHACNIFFKKYLEEEHYKHTANTKQVFGKNKKEAIYAKEFEYATTKEGFRSNDLRKKLSLVNGSSQDASKYFKKDSFHVIVGDLPYGIAHGNTTGKAHKSITRNPSELLDQCLPEWFQVLKKGGAIVVAWNSFVVSKRQLEDVFIKHGFTVFTETPYDNFEHMVDKSIKRDIIVAKKI